MNHCEAHLMIKSKVIDCKNLKMVIKLFLFLFLFFYFVIFLDKRRLSGKCNVKRYLFGIRFDVPTFKDRIFTDNALHKRLFF